MDHAHATRSQTRRSGPPARRRAGFLLAAAFGLAAVFGALPHQGLPGAHADENMGICIPTGLNPVLPVAAGPGATHAVAIGAAEVFDPACGDPFGRLETAPAKAQYNSTGIVNTVEHLATGSYAVRFTGLGAGSGVPEVTAVGAAPDRCRIGGWQPEGFDQQVTVLCADAQGNPVDWEFTAAFTSERSKYAVFGYLRADQPGASQAYQPSVQYTSSGVPVTVQRTETGHYTVTRTQPGPTPGADLVSAYGTADGRSICELTSTTSSVAYVACFAGTTAADMPFTLTYGVHGNLLGVPDATQGAGGPASGYAWTDTTAGSAPDPARRFASNDPGTGAGWSQFYDQAGHTAQITMPLSMAAGVPQVVAAGSDSSFCSVAGDWTGGSLPVQCWSGDGAPVQEPFEAVFTGIR